MTVALTLLAVLAVATAIWLAGTVLVAMLMRVAVKTIAFGVGPTLATLPLSGGRSFELRAVPVVSNVTFVTRAEAQPDQRLFADLGRFKKFVLALSGCAACLLVAALFLGPESAVRAAAASWTDVFRAVTHARDVDAQWGPIVEAARTLGIVELLGLAAAKVGGFNLLPLAGLSGWSALTTLLAARDGSSAPIVETFGKFTLIVLFGLLILWAVSGVEYVARVSGMVA